MADESEDIVAASTADVRIVETWGDAGPLLQAQTQQLADAVVNTLKLQISSSTLEANGLSRVYAAADAEYAALQTSIPAISAFYTAAKEQEAKISPALQQLDDIEKTVAELEAVAAVLNTQSSRLETAIKDALV